MWLMRTFEILCFIASFMCGSVIFSIHMQPSQCYAWRSFALQCTREDFEAFLYAYNRAESLSRCSFCKEFSFNRHRCSPTTRAWISAGATVAYSPALPPEEAGVGYIWHGRYYARLFACQSALPRVAFVGWSLLLLSCDMCTHIAPR